MDKSATHVLGQPYPQKINTADVKTTPRSIRSPRVWLVGPIAFLYFSSFTMSLFGFSQYVYARLKEMSFPNVTLDTSISFCVQNESSPNFLVQTVVQQKAAKWTIYYGLAGGIPAIIFNLVLGAYTDRFGRKFLFFVCIFGSLIRTVICTLGIHYEIRLEYFAVGFVLEGFTGQLLSILQASYSYIADITAPGKERSLVIVMVEFCIGLAITGLSFATGYFIQAYGFIYPLVTASVILVLAVFIIIFLLPESYPKEIRPKHAYVMQNIKDVFAIYFSKEYAGKRWKYCILFLAFTFQAIEVYGRINIEGLYQLNAPFCWAPINLGWFGALRSGIQQIIAMCLVRPFQFCLTDEGIAILGSLSFAGGFVLEALATSNTELYLVPVIGICGMLTGPMIKSTVSKITAPDKQGAAFSSYTSVETLCNMVGAILANAIYTATLGIFNGAVFIVFASFNILCMILLVVYVIGSKLSKDNNYHILGNI